MSSQTNWEADKMLDVYIYDYLVKRNLQDSAKAFQAEGKVSSDPVAIDAPGGFLFEWWSVFWDIFIARTNEKHSEVAASYIETQQLKAREQQQQQQQQLQQNPQQQPQQQQSPHQQPQQQQQQQQQQQPLQMQLVHQQHQNQQLPRRDGTHIAINGAQNGLGPGTISRQNSANVMPTKIYEDRLKQPPKLEDANIKLLDASQASMLKPTVTSGQPSGQLLQNAAGNLNSNLQQVQARNPTMPGGSQDIKHEVVSGGLNQMSPATDPASFGASGIGHPKAGLLSPGLNQGTNSLPLKGWPLTGLDQFRSNVPSPKSFIQSSQQYHQLQMFNPQQQQQFLLQAQQAQGNLSTGSSSLLAEIEAARRGVGSPLQAASPGPRSNEELLMKMRASHLQQHAQQPHHQQHQQQLQQLGSQVQQSPSQQPQTAQQIPPAATPQQLQDRLINGGGGLVDGNFSNHVRGIDQVASKGQTGRKRKQPASSSGPANSTGTGNTAGPSSAPSTPSTHTPGDGMGALQHSSSTSKPMTLYNSDGAGALATSSNQLADIDRFGEDGSLDDNVESFLSHEEADQGEPLFGGSKRSPSGQCADISKGFTFLEVACLQFSHSKVVSCHFSPDGKLLASAGHDKKAVLWNMDTLKLQSTLLEHSYYITDVRFSPNSARLATSSFDRTVRVWNTENPNFSLRTFTGHRGQVTSLDFHPNNEDLLCSCDAENDIRYWNITQGISTRAFQGGTNQVRFQPRAGRLLAAASENVVTIFDVETEQRLHTLQRHAKNILTVCWDATGDYVASVSNDSVRVWALGSGGDGECVHELSSNGNIFHSCVFHPLYPQILVIGCYQSLELWSMQDKTSMTVSAAHEGLIAALAQSPVTGMIASASHDKYVKLWK